MVKDTAISSLFFFVAVNVAAFATGIRDTPISPKVTYVKANPQEKQIRLIPRLRLFGRNQRCENGVCETSPMDVIPVDPDDPIQPEPDPYFNDCPCDDCECDSERMFTRSSGPLRNLFRRIADRFRNRSFRLFR